MSFLSFFRRGSTYDFAFQRTINEIKDDFEKDFEKIRDESYKQAFSQLSIQLKNIPKNDLELTRIGCLHQLDDLKEKIEKKMEEAAHKVTIAAIAYTDLPYVLCIPVITLLVLDKITASQIAALIALTITFISCTDPVHRIVSRYLYGKTSEELVSLYALYGVAEATANVADYRNISTLKRDYCVFSGRHRKAP